MADQEYISLLQNTIYSLLINFIEDQNRVKKYVEQKPMEIWIKAFTHKSINPEFNYESLETLGDRLLKGLFAAYLTDRFKKITEDSLSNMDAIYTSKLRQRDLAKQLGFEPILRSEIKTAGSLEDTFESFIGALYQISSTVDNIGRGWINCTNFVTWIFNKIKIDITETSSKKTFVQQTFSRLGLGEVKEVADKEKYNDFAYHIEITPVAQQFFADKDIYFDNILGIGYGKTKKEAVNGAYFDAFKRMQDAGINKQWADRERKQWEFEAPEFQPYLPKAKENLRKLGYGSMYFNLPRNLMTDAKGMSISLIGVRDNTNERVVLDSIVTKNETEGKKILLQRLAERKV